MGWCACTSCVVQHDVPTNCACLMQNWPDVMFQLQSVAGEAVSMGWHMHVHDAGLLS